MQVTPQSALSRPRWLPGFILWDWVALPVTAGTTFMAAFVAFTLGPIGSESPGSGLTTALAISALLACLLWFSYLGALLFSNVSVGARQVQPVLVSLWLTAIASTWLI